jgi:hypothetical protein
MIQFNSNSVVQSSRFMSDVGARKKSSAQQRGGQDSVYISDPNTKKSPKSLDLNWSSSMRMQASQRKDVLSLKRMSQMLPRDKQHLPKPELLNEVTAKKSLGDATQRLLWEGVDGSAKIAFEQEVERLYDRYGEDLGMDQPALTKTLTNLLRKIEGLVDDHAIKPWSPHDNSSSSTLGDELGEAISRHRQMVMESSGDFSRVLSELTVEASSGGDAELIRLGDFVLRMSEALDVGSTNDLRAKARSELSGDSIQSIREGALEKGRSFLEFFRGLEA